MEKVINFGQVISNIIINGLQAYISDNKKGNIDITAIQDDKETKILIKDYAGGIPEKMTPYIFKNILTTKGTKGTGIGLYLAYSVVKVSFNGDITFDTKSGEGTEFVITLPNSNKEG